MRIKYSVLFPVIFILFCGIFIALLLRTQCDIKDRDNIAASDKALILKYSAEFSVFLENLDDIRSKLKQDNLEASIQVFRDIEENIKKLDSFMSEMSAKKKATGEKSLNALKKDVEDLGESVRKGDKKQCYYIIDRIIGRK